MNGVYGTVLIAPFLHHSTDEKDTRTAAFTQTQFLGTFRQVLVFIYLSWGWGSPCFWSYRGLQTFLGCYHGLQWKSLFVAVYQLVFPY